jgi:hypothetical protein
MGTFIPVRFPAISFIVDVSITPELILIAYFIMLSLNVAMLISTVWSTSEL